MKNLLDIWRPERSNPWRELSALQRRLDRFFDEFAGTAPIAEAGRDVDFVPACDFEEVDNNYLISLDVPGMTKDQIQVELAGNTLTIKGEQKEEKKENKLGQRYYERYHGQFERSFVLPQASETEKVEASYHNGVLRISVPKSATAKSRRIEIGEGQEKAAAPAKLPRAEEKKVSKPSEKAA